MMKIKPSFDQNRSVLGQVAPLSTPFRVTIDTSEVCNFKCNYCYRSSKPSESWGYAGLNNLMQMDVFEKTIEHLLAFPESPRIIALSGQGEPLANNNIATMARHVREVGLAGTLELHSNGALLTEKMAKDIATAGFNKIVFSLQGLSAEKYESVCGARINFDVFKYCLATLYNNKNKDLVVNIKIVDAALDVGEEPLFYQMFCEMADNLFIEKVVPLWQNQLEYDDKEKRYTNKFGENYGIVECCPILFTNITISPDGTIWPCCVIDPPFALGNVMNTSLFDAWMGNKRKALMIGNLQSGKMCHLKCNNCYFPDGYVKSTEDIIDSYRDQILERLGK